MVLILSKVLLLSCLCMRDIRMLDVVHQIIAPANTQNAIINAVVAFASVEVIPSAVNIPAKVITLAGFESVNTQAEK